eukprot:scaffold106_cov380-Prasinococcus_capsulatus_cf.AAC.46
MHPGAATGVGWGLASGTGAVGENPRANPGRSAPGAGSSRAGSGAAQAARSPFVRVARAWPPSRQSLAPPAASGHAVAHAEGGGHQRARRASAGGREAPHATPARAPHPPPAEACRRSCCACDRPDKTSVPPLP